MSPTLTTFVFELANFLLLVALLGWLFFKPVRKALEDRQAAEQQRVAAQAAQERAVAKGRAELEAQRAAFEQESDRLRKQRLAAAETEATGIVNRAREAADHEQERSRRILAHLDDAQVERLAAAVAATTREAVARLLSTLQAGDLDVALLHAACRQLQTTSGGLPGAVLVESAAPLDEVARHALATAAGSDDAVQFRVAPELGAGLRVTTPTGLIDASAAGMAAHAERVLARRLVSAAPNAGS